MKPLLQSSATLHFFCVSNLYSKKKIVLKKICCFLWPLTTGDVWWQDGQIKEEEELFCSLLLG
jgi:hypothetical protein